MPDSPAPTESLIKAESEPQRDPIVATSTSAIILISTLLLILSAGWALYDEAYGQRPWKGMQREFVKRYSAYLKSIRKDAGKSEAEVKESPEYEQLDADAKAAEERVRDRRKEIDNQAAKIQAKLDAKAKALGEKAELLKEPTELAKKRDDYLKNHVSLLPQKSINDLINKNENSFDYTILGHQINVNDYGIVDRCELCHLGAREPLTIKPADMAPGGPGKKPDDLAEAFVSHPRKELLQIHKPDKFGCSACHGGNGRATTSVEKAHGLNPFWLHPLFHKENTEAGCQTCHANDRVTEGA